MARIVLGRVMMREYTVKNSVKSTVCCLFVLTFVFLAACSDRLVRDSDDWTGAEVTGQLTDISDDPISGAYLYAYIYGRTVLGPAQAMSEPSGDNGRYQMVMPPGEYTLVARKRISGSISGPLRNGDLVGRISGAFPVRRGDHYDVDVVLRVFTMGTAGDPSKILDTDTKITGIITGINGKAIGGAHVFAYRGKLRRDPPDFLSAATGPDGRFSISLPGGGEYSIGARTGLRGRPGAGDMVGFWGETGGPKTVKGGRTIKNVELKLVPFSERIK